MREIKFRAFKGEGWIYFTLNQLIDGNATNFEDYGLTNWSQYTGLKDKNGKEIYEGDILVVRELHDGDEMAWHQSNGPAIPCLVSWDDNYKRFDFSGCSRVIYSPKHFEVIGNIYENKELLK